MIGLNRLYVPVMFTYLLATSIASADNYVWIIGGGPELENSQSQIELNVKWANDVIARRADNPKIKLFYSAGDSPTPDVVNFVATGGDNEDFLIFDYVFSKKDVSRKQYYKHSIKNVVSTTRADKLLPILNEDFKRLTSGDKALILYNGHGGLGASNTRDNFLKLWEYSKLTVHGFEKLLSSIDNNVPTRFIMTQCYSGAFGQSIYPEANKYSPNIKANRCGFLAESERRESEGCTASAKVNDYRDYTTYFFAALDGKTRINGPLLSDPDLNKDHAVTLREAHLYTLANAYSTDLSRSTSEQYLEKWQPWYLRWISRNDASQTSIYYKTARQVAKNNKLNTDILTNPTLSRSIRHKLSSNFDKLKNHRDTLRAQTVAAQNNITSELEKLFPNIRKNYKSKFKQYDDSILSTIRSVILKHPEHDKLISLFTERETLISPLLDAERQLTQIAKVQRLLKLAKLDSYFQTFSDNTSKTNYDSILSCEDSSL